MILSQNITYINNLQSKIENTIKKINNSGIENTTENLFHKFKNDNFQAIKEIELKGIESAEMKYQKYDNIFNSMNTKLNNFRELLLEKNTDTINKNGIEIINIELSVLKETFENLTNSEDKNEKLFEHTSELLIGDNIKVPRTFGLDYIKIGGIEITELLENFINDDNPNLDKFDKIIDFISIKRSEVGARWNGVKSMKSIYENQQFTENEFMSKKYKLEESIMELNDLTVNYEALMKTIAKISTLSLVNYM